MAIGGPQGAGKSALVQMVNCMVANPVEEITILGALVMDPPLYYQCLNFDAVNCLGSRYCPTSVDSHDAEFMRTKLEEVIGVLQTAKTLPCT